MFVPDGAGAAKFAIDVRIATLKTFLTLTGAVLGAHVTGFSVWMIHAFSHVKSFFSIRPKTQSTSLTYQAAD